MSVYVFNVCFSGNFSDTFSDIKAVIKRKWITAMKSLHLFHINSFEQNIIRAAREAWCRANICLYKVNLSNATCT